jgi:hypothetical protein
MRGLLLGALVLAACVPPTSTPAAPTPSAPVTFGATPTSVATQSAVPTTTFADGGSAPWPVVLYEGEGFIVSQRTESTKTELARPCGPVVRLEAGPAGLLAWCSNAPADTNELRLISLPDGRVTVIASGAMPSNWPAAVSPDGRLAAAFRWGNCPMPAPVCQTRAVLVDLTSKAEREIVPSGYHLGSTLEWTALGLTFFQPECAETGCVGDADKRGTFVWDGSAFKRWGDLRFVASSGDWTLLERLRSFGQEPRTVVVRGPQGETALSAGHALAIASNGETLVWRPGSSFEQRGMLLRLAPDGRVLWQADLVGSVLKMIGSDAFLAASPENKLEIYDLKRMLRFAPTTPINHVAAGVAR